jgi:amidase
MSTWQEKAKAKREEILAAIPKEWRIEAPSIEEKPDVTGSFIQQFLTEREIEITETTADDIVKHTVSGRWSAEEVTRAFCHRAALAHQLVNCLNSSFARQRANERRLAVYMKSSSTPPLLMPKRPMITMPNIRSQWDLFTASLLV